MENKTAKFLLSAGIFLFLVGSGVAAWAESCEVPMSCTTGSGWSIELLRAPTLQSAEVCKSALGLGVTECYLWEYEVQNSYGNTSGLTQLLLTIPTTCGGVEPLFAGADDPNIELYPPGVGDPTSKLGLDILTIAVARFEPNNTEGSFAFYSPEKTMAEATVAVSVKKGDGSCIIGGPSHSCYEEPEDIITLSSTEFISTYDDNTGRSQLFRIKRDQDTKCITDAFECYEDDCTSGRPLDSVPIEEALTLHNIDANGAPVETPGQWSGGTNQKCNEAIFKSVGNNTWVWISGRRVWR